jgi:hypothetical protein
MKQFLILASLAIVSAAVAQQPTAPAGTKVEPTEVQVLKLKVAQKDAIIAQQQSQSLHQQASMADQQAQQALTALQKLAADVKAENKWGEDVQFEPNQLTFTRADKPVNPHGDPYTPTPKKP